MSLPALEQLRSLAVSAREAVRGPRRRLAWAGTMVLLLALLLIARRGTFGARGAVALTGLLVVAAVLAFRRLEARWLADPARAIGRLARPVDPERADRALRALSLVDAGGAPRDPGTSAALAELHLARAVAALPQDRIVEAAQRRAGRYGTMAIVLGCIALAVFGSNAFAVLEGADVLVARGGRAPFSMRWLEDVEMRARPPEYLHEDERPLLAGDPVTLPRGTLLTVRGVATRPGRRLMLSDGTNEVPFVDDGSGRLVARWPLAADAPLRVVARFGDVVIPEADATAVTSLADETPVVKLEDAPRTLRLATAEDGGDIPIRYEATDDHGLREVHLVLRSGTKEERRVLARLDGETRIDRGGYVLKARDGFLRRSHAPVEVRVEAKDNDPITGPKWGASASITVLPPDVGEPESMRMAALRKVRDQLVDGLAGSLARTFGGDAGARAAEANEDRAALVAAEQSLEEALGASYAGIRVSRRLAAILRGSMRHARDAAEKEVKAPTAANHVALTKASERVVLVVDAVVRGLAMKDSRDAARQLGDVADDLAQGALEAQRPPDRERSEARMNAATTVLRGGARSLLTLGSLGRDLGEIVDAYLLRVDRARGEKDWLHAELAARDLSARMHEPDPSFGARGSKRAGGEAGGARGTPGDDAGEGDEAEQAFNEAAQELERLSQEHATGLGSVEQALSQGAREEDKKALKEEAKKHAQNVREGASGLPSIGAGSDSWTSKGAAAREHAEQMANALEDANPSDAVASGRNAISALDEARRLAARERWFGGPTSGESEAERRIREARQKIEPEVRWAEQKLEELRKKAAERAAGDLRGEGDREESLADRARELAGKGREQGALPSPALDSLEGAERAAREAARALQRGDAQQGLDAQREAQRLLDQARESLGEGQDEARDRDGDGNVGEGHADIPKADAHKGPEEFRKRVVNGLGQPSSGRLRDAVRRYAEGLLR